MTVHLLQGDAFQIPLRDGTVQCVITSPPFWNLRDYQVEGQIGLEPTVEQYVANLVTVFREVRRVLRPDGIAWLNLGDSYASSGTADKTGLQRLRDWGTYHYHNSQKATRVTQGRAPTPPNLKPKNLCMIPARVALALQADGWWLRSAIPHLKKNAMPESVTDRPGVSHEYWFLLSKSKSYFYDAEAVRMPASETTVKRAAQGSGLAKYSATIKPIYGNHDDAHSGLRKGRDFHRDVESGRNRRTSDAFFESLDTLIAEQYQYLAHLERVRDRGGFLLDEDGGPLALVVNTASYAGAHFATFPEKLITPLLLCSTSARGACPACGAAWRRVVERKQISERDDTGRTHGLNHQRRTSPGAPPERGWETERTTTGWLPTCPCYGAPERGPVTCGKCGGTGRERGYARRGVGDAFTPPDRTTYGGTKRDATYSESSIETGSPCPACDGSGTVTGDVWPADVDDWPTVPCTVLDPFSGTATVGMVAIKHRRRFVGLELNREYIGLAQKRTGAVQVRLL